MYLSIFRIITYYRSSIVLSYRTHISFAMPKKEIAYKGRVLFLHGFAQSSSVFYAKSSALRKRFQSLGYKTIYLNAPINLIPSDLPSSDSLSKFNTVVVNEEEKTNYRGWWTKKPDHTYKLDDAIACVEKYIKDNEIVSGSPEDDKSNQILDSDRDLPIVGLVGFSQGAAFAGALVHTFEQLFGVDTLEFALLYSGFKIDTKLMPEYAELYSQKNGSDTNVRMLHIVGELDTVVGDDRAYTLYDLTRENSHLLKHPGGHFVPNSRIMIDQVVNWIENKNEESEKKEEKKPKAEKSEVDDLLAMMEKFGA